MKIFSSFFLFFALITFLACNTDQTLSKITNLEKEVAENPIKEKQNELVSAYLQWISEHPTDHVKCNTFLDNAAIISLALNEPEQAVKYWESAINEHSSESKNPEIMSKIAETYSVKLKDINASNIFYGGILEKYPNSSIAKSIQSKFPSTTPLATQIQNLNNTLITQESKNVNPIVVKDLIVATNAYQILYPEDEKNATQLWESAELARTINQPKTALKFLDQISAKYPKFPNMGNVEFTKAYILDYDLNAFDKAKPIYESFLKNYPKHELADDAKFMLTQAGKSDEEIIATFNKK